VIFGNLRKCSGDLRKPLEMFGLSSGIFGSVRGIFGRFRVTLADTICPIFPKLDSFCVFTQSLLKTVQIKSQIGQFSEIKG